MKRTTLLLSLVTAISVNGIATTAFAQANRPTNKKTVKKAVEIKKEAKEQKAEGPALPLTGFIQQVSTGNDDFVASDKKAKGFDLRTDEYKLFTRPQLIGEASYTDNQTLQASPAFMGVATKTEYYSLGVKQKTTFGLDAALSYRYIDTTVSGVNPTFFPQPHFILASPVLELNQSLWRNWGGRQTRGKQEFDRATTASGKYQEEFNMIEKKSEAEDAYWRLVVSRKLVTAAKGNLERAQRIASWFTKRSDMQLSDRSDSYQGQAILATRKVELQQALDAERQAARDFNSMRGSPEEDVNERLDELKYDQIVALTTPNVLPPQQRRDVLAAQEKARADAAKAKENAELLKADVSAFATLSLNGRDGTARTSVDQSFNTTYPNTVVGVRLNVPLSFGTSSDSKAGYQAQADASANELKRRSYEAERKLLDLSRRFEDSKRRLGLAVELEEAQKKKADYEKDRRGRGRSTTYQVIMFEQEYAAAQVSRINLESEILDIYSELKTFGGQP